MNLKELPKESLQIYIKRLNDELYSKLDEFRADWIVRKKCNCVATLPPKVGLNCNHLRKAIDEEFKKENKEIIDALEVKFNQKLDLLK